MSGAASGPGRRFRLRGELAGQERRFPLASGEVWIGSARANDVVLPLRGVSRRHARLFVDADGAKLEDLDSKNGVAVNGTLVGQARLKAGDEIRFGPALLRLEEVDAEDVELAIAVVSKAPMQSRPKLRPRPSPSIPCSRRSRIWARETRNGSERSCRVTESSTRG